MDLKDYQIDAKTTAIYPRQDNLGLYYTALGLAGEAGEVANKVKKILRDDSGIIKDDKKDEIALELGDVLWYLSQLAEELDLWLSDIALDNLSKLKKRHNSNTIQGSGDSRGKSVEEINRLFEECDQCEIDDEWDK